MKPEEIIDDIRRIIEEMRQRLYKIEEQLENFRKRVTSIL